MSGTSHSWTIPLNISVTLGSGNLTANQQANPSSRPTSMESLAHEGWFGRDPEPVFPGASQRFSVGELTNTDFSWQNALNAALCSALAYRPDQFVRNSTRNTWGFDNCQLFAASNTECFIASNDDAVVVAFRGTQQISDWLVNLNLATKSTSYGSVHRGFFFAFDIIRRRLEDALDTLDARDKKIILAGHSLGGAIATIAAAEWYGTYPITGVYTIGQPAVGFSSLRSYIAIMYPRMFHRLVNDDDIVPQVPPGYRHVGKLYHFERDGDVRFESRPASPIDPVDDTPTMNRAEFEALRVRMAAAKVATPLSATNESSDSHLVTEGFFPSVADHNTERYLERILGQLNS